MTFSRRAVAHPSSFVPSLIAQATALTLATLALQAHAQQAAAPRASASASADDGAPRAKDDVIRLGTITVTGSGDRLGAGQIINEDTVKARSTVTRASMEKDRATGNLYQAISLLPGVNTFNHDGTGLFGGGITMRGFNSDQIGMTINGVPVNDSGNYAAFPQQYLDQENVCTNTVAQGSSDQETPHIGASGGSISLSSCDASPTQRIRFGQTLGGRSLSRTYARFDTGRMFDNKLASFISYTHSQANKWKGQGQAKRDHVDVGFNLDLSPGNRVLGSIVYNKAVNNNIQSISLAQLNQFGYNYDFSETFSGRLTPVNGTAQTEAGPNPAFYKLAVNPFENAIASLSGSFKLNENLLLKVQPYFWYGYGTGGVQQQTLNETNGFLNRTLGTLTGSKDINGDGDTRDRIIVARSNVTQTQRPGITTEVNWLAGEHSIKVGLWVERAKHTQTGPAVPVDAAGNAATIWLDDGRITRADGSLYQNRDWTTLSKASAFYVTDNFNFANDRGLISAGVRFPRIERDFTNRPSEANNSQVGYNLVRSWSDTLPQFGVRYKLDRQSQVFANVGKNFRAPTNLALSPGNNVSVVGGVASVRVPVLAETSVNTDIGYRYQGAFSFSASAFFIDFKNRQARALDPNTNLFSDTNVGKVANRGIEAELGTRPWKGFTGYASVTSQSSEMKSNLPVSATLALPTAGKEFPLTPRRMFALSVQYANGPFYARLKAKETGRQFATLVNDEEVPAYAVLDLDGGYNLGSLLGKNTQLRFNVSNLFNKQYRNPSSNGVLNARAIGTQGAATVFYFLGAPRLVSTTLSTDF